MNNKTFQQQVNDISPYSQVNKAFRHVYGSAAAAVLSTLIYKYTYWKQNNGLTTVKTPKGKTLYKFYISKIDISIDSGVSISSLENNSKNNPLNILEHLKLVEKISSKINRKSDGFVLFPKRIMIVIKKATELFKEDLEMCKKLSPGLKRNFYKALRSKQTRSEVYDKFKLEIDDHELAVDDLEDISENPVSIEINTPPNEGITKNTNKEQKQEHEKKTNSDKMNQVKTPKGKQQVTVEELKEGIRLYHSGEIDAQQIFNLLILYMQKRKDVRWSMSAQDEKYIKYNLKCVEPEYMNATIEYIDTNIKRITNGERDMRFGSILAGIFEKVIEAGIGYEDMEPAMSPSKYKKMLDKLPKEINIEFEDLL